MDLHKKSISFYVTVRVPVWSWTSGNCFMIFRRLTSIFKRFRIVLPAARLLWSIFRRVRTSNQGNRTRFRLRQTLYTCAETTEYLFSTVKTLGRVTVESPNWPTTSRSLSIPGEVGHWGQFCWSFSCGRQKTNSSGWPRLVQPRWKRTRIDSLPALRYLHDVKWAFATSLIQEITPTSCSGVSFLS